MRPKVLQAFRTDVPDASARFAPRDMWWPLSIDLRREPAGPSAADLPLKVEPVAAPRPPGADRMSGSIGFAAAIIAHAAVLVALALVGPPEPSGGGGQWLEAISVEIVMTQVIEARETRPTETISAASGPVAPDDGDRSEPAQAAREEPLPAKPEQPRPIETVTPDTRVAMVEEVTPLKAEPDRPTIVRAEEAEEQKTPSPETRSQGGVAALTVQGDTPATARASASPGALQKYAMQVRTALARNKPDGRGTRGTATITFGISESGKVRFTRLSHSSGNSMLDKAALAAVLRTSFPVPPKGMTETELTYAIPFHFK
jgi:protein TonB